jgi:hypothetical protein
VASRGTRSSFVSPRGHRWRCLTHPSRSFVVRRNYSGRMVLLQGVGEGLSLGPRLALFVVRRTWWWWARHYGRALRVGVDWWLNRWL